MRRTAPAPRGRRSGLAGRAAGPPSAGDSAQRPPADGIAAGHTGTRLTPYAVRVLAAVDSIPAGSVMTYGDVAEYVGSGSARTVGMVLSRHGHEVPWQRVVLSTGEPAPSHPAEARALLRAEGVPMRGDRVDMTRARWDGRSPAADGR